MGNKKNHIRTGKEVPCKICGRLVYRKGYLLKKFTVFYCSRKCLGFDNAKRLADQYKDKPRDWLIGKNNKAWKGDNVGYFALHDWVVRHKGSPKKCEDCGSIDKSKYEWANVSGKYRRDLKDWRRLCSKCHSVFDDRSGKMREVRKYKFWSSNK